MLEMYGVKHTYESESEDYSAEELKEIFSRLMVQATYPPSIIDLAEGGHFECEYKEDAE